MMSSERQTILTKYFHCSGGEKVAPKNLTFQEDSKLDVKSLIVDTKKSETKDNGVEIKENKGVGKHADYLEITERSGTPKACETETFSEAESESTNNTTHYKTRLPEVADGEVETPDETEQITFTRRDFLSEGSASDTEEEHRAMGAFVCGDSKSKEKQDKSHESRDNAGGSGAPWKVERKRKKEMTSTNSKRYKQSTLNFKFQESAEKGRNYKQLISHPSESRDRYMLRKERGNEDIILSKRFTNEGRTSKQYTDKDRTSKKFTNEDRTSKQFTDKDRTSKKFTDKDRTSTRFTDKDTKDYRNGYPGKKDDPRLNDNLRFYRGEIMSTPKGAYIDVIHENWWADYELLERHHGYIQWLFPIRESGMNSMAQPLQLHEAEAIKSETKTKKRVLKSYKLMLDFYGMKLQNEETGQLERSNNWKKCFDNLNRSSHNYLRITRILKCLGELGYEHLKKGFIEFMLDEALVHHTLVRTLTSCRDYWIGTLRNDQDRNELYKYIDEHE